MPTCPDFTVDELAAHVGEFCGWWTHNLCEGSGRPKPPYSVEVGPEGRVEWLRALGGHLVSELRATPRGHRRVDLARARPVGRVRGPAAPATSWRCTGSMRSSLGASRSPVPAELAADGIEEVFLLATSPAAVTRVGSKRAGRTETRQTLHLHGTDFEAAEWFVVLGPDGVQVTHEHAKG